VTAAAAPLAALAVAGAARRWMSDDGFINLRVVDNALHGHGLGLDGSRYCKEGLGL
jgi:hypothetical protein